MNLRLEQLLHELEVFQFRVSQPQAQKVLGTALGIDNFLQLIAAIDLIYVSCQKLRKHPELTAAIENKNWVEESIDTLSRTRTSLRQTLERCGITEVKI